MIMFMRNASEQSPNLNLCEKRDIKPLKVLFNIYFILPALSGDFKGFEKVSAFITCTSVCQCIYTHTFNACLLHTLVSHQNYIETIKVLI